MNCLMRREKIESLIMELPNDMMLDIFIRLGCKDIVSCRGVCRAWYNLISDPTFSTVYTRFSPLTTLLVTRRENCSDYFILIQVAGNRELIRGPIMPKVPRDSEGFSTMRVIGSCNGLLFFVLRHFKYDRSPPLSEQVYFCNPLLGGFVALREFEMVTKFVRRTEYKIGFVPSINKIKLLRLSFSRHGRVIDAHILTFRQDDQWRQLNDPFSFLLLYSNGTCFNGAYHWVSAYRNVDGICTFDFGEEKCGRISKPPGLKLSALTMRTNVLNNHLCLIECPGRSPEMTIWTMKEYGVGESWSKEILLKSWFPCEGPHSLFPFAIVPNGDILFLNCSVLHSFSPKTKQCTILQFHDAPPVINISNATTFAPRFYALGEDVSGHKHRECLFTAAASSL